MTNQPLSNDYLTRIHEAIDRSRPLQEWLILRSSQDGKQPSNSTKLLLDALSKPIDPQQWLSDSNLAGFLPLLLKGSSEQKNFSSLEPWYRLLLGKRVNILSILKGHYYPLSIALAALIVFYFVCATIIPEFQAMFSDFSLRLPAPTKLLFVISNFIVGHTLPFIAMILGAILLVFGLVKLVAYLLNRFENIGFVRFLRLGTKSSLGSMARWSGTLSELVAIGTPIDRAILAAGLASQRPLLLAQSQKLASAILKDPEKPLCQQPATVFFSSSSIEALEQNRQTRAGTSVLRAIAQSYAVRWASREDFSYNWLGPILLLFIAKMIFFLVISLFMPLISLLTSLSG